MFYLYNVKNLFERKEFDFVFVDGVAYKPSCFNCRYAGEPKQDSELGCKYAGCCLMCDECVMEDHYCENHKFEPREVYNV